MKRFFENVGLALSAIIVIALMLSGSFVFAQNKNVIEEKSYHVDAHENDGYVEKDIELSTSMIKKFENSKNSYEYQLSVVDGNVISKSMNTGHTEKIYSKGDAKYITELNYYYYDAKYIVIITENGELYANIYKSNQSQMKFKKIKTNNKVRGIKVVETTQRFYEYPAVKVFGLNDNGDWELIRL